MPYVIHEQSRLPARESYNGPACLSADVTGGQVYADKRKALNDARKLGEEFTVSQQPCSEPLPFDFSAQLAERILTEPNV